MQRCQILDGDILQGRHRILVVGLNCRDNCGSSAKAISESAGFSITQLKRLAGASDVGRFVRIDVPHCPVPHLREIIGLILRRDHYAPIQPRTLDEVLQRLVRYLGSADHHQMHTHDVGMVAIGSGQGSLEGGFATLIKHLIRARYPGVVYQPHNPAYRLSDEQLAKLGLTGRADDPMPSWRCRRSDWGDADEREVLSIQNLTGRLMPS